jgi:hypothetical protein
VTVIAESPRGSLERPLRALGRCRHVRGHAYGIAALAAAAVVAGALVGEQAGSGTRTHQHRPAGTGTLAEAGAYRFPLGCLGATLSGGSHSYDANRTGPCWHYGVYVTAVLRRVDGTWRLSLEARGRSCPRLRLPAPIRSALAACVKPNAGVLHSPHLRSPRTDAG